MGAPHTKANMRTTILIIVSLAIATASMETIVPEETLYELDDDLLQARQTLDQMKSSGKSDAECRKLVQESKNEITTNCKTSQKILDSLATGSQCLDLGLAEVAKMKQALEAADKHTAKCKAEVTAASTASVKFGARTFSSLTEGKCESFFTSSAYTTATTNYKTAVTAHEKATGASEEATKAHANAVSAAKTARHNCLCKTRDEHEVVFSAEYSKTTTSQGLKTWEFAHRLECVLDGKTSCRIPAMCKVNKPKLHAAVKEEMCGPTIAQKKEAKKKADEAAEKAKVKKELADKAKEKADKEEKKAKAAAKAKEKADKDKKEKAMKEKAEKKRVEDEKAAKKKELSDKAAAKAKEAKEKATEKANKWKSIGGIALFVNGNSNVMHYDSPYWTNSKTGNLGGGNIKYDAFNKPANWLKVEMNGKSYTWRHNKNLSLRQLFAGGTINLSMPHSTSVAWRAMGGPNAGLQNHCNRLAINNNQLWDHWKTDCRIGMIMNQENDCKTPDSAVGLGFKLNAGNNNGGRIVAGAVCGCCSNSGSCRNKGATAKITVG